MSIHEGTETTQNAASSQPDDAAIDFDRTVHLARYETDEERLYIERDAGVPASKQRQLREQSAFQKATRVCSFALPVTWIAALGVASLAIWTLTQTPATTPSLLWGLLVPTFFLFTIVVGFFYRMWMRIGNARLPSSIGMSPASDPRYRLRVIADPLIAERFQAQLNELPEIFEAYIFRVASRRRARSAQGLFALLAAALFFAVFYISRVYVFTAIPLLVAGFAAAHVFIWPCYVRVRPGRIDLLEYGVLGTGVPRVRTQSLRDASVLVRLPYEVIVHTPGEPEGWLYQACAGFREPKFLFPASVLAAARSSHPTPPLPDDALMG